MIDWNLWKALPTLKLWEAVALVLEIEPDSLKRPAPSWDRDPKFDEQSFPNRARYEAFEKALYFAKRAANRDEGPIYVQLFQGAGSSRAAAEVRLADAVSFFASCGFPSIPTELSNLVQHPEPTPKPLKEDLSTRERDSLLKILYGMATGAYKFDPDSKRNDVSSEIAGDCARAGCLIDQDTVRKYLREASQRFGSSRR